MTSLVAESNLLCHCATSGLDEKGTGVADGKGDALTAVVGPPWKPMRPREMGLVSYSADLLQTLSGPVVRSGDVWHLLPEDGKSFEPATLFLYANGILIKPQHGDSHLSIAWSPFSLVQSCRLHSVQADNALPWLRLFKVSVFQHGSTHFFAPRSEQADGDRARWVAEISRALRSLTQSLFPEFTLHVDPLPGASWTASRLLAGYLLLCQDDAVSLAFCELHSHWDGAATFAAYEDEYCDTQVVRLGIDMHTCVSERVGVDCSCFSFDGYHFTTRSCGEKLLWLRAISNVKVKLRHRAPNPTLEELRSYRESILEYVGSMLPPEGKSRKAPLLPRRAARRGHLPAGPLTNVGPTGPNPGTARHDGAVEGDGSSAKLQTPEGSSKLTGPLELRPGLDITGESNAPTPPGLVSLPDGIEPPPDGITPALALGPTLAVPTPPRPKDPPIDQELSSQPAFQSGGTPERQIGQSPHSLGGQSPYSSGRPDSVLKNEMMGPRISGNRESAFQAPEDGGKPDCPPASGIAPLDENADVYAASKTA
eukprot:TRINITY_DN10297_c0_g2_i1.p1 TRINITY_DN10297_c0_g2~~TRINITY_DN10297_c0_g2_i1.p1  ORF type:complete len:538 (-),score=52.23 TRINITY_DN10297_c0_g2_i1:21-1634(-)